jgi:hypothetical protein
MKANVLNNSVVAVLCCCTDTPTFWRSSPCGGHQPCRFPVRQCDPMRGRLLSHSGVHRYPGGVAANGSPCASLVLVVVMVCLPLPLLFHTTDQ